PGGQTMNPSTEELLQAIESLGTENVIVLPNNKNIILTAQQAKGLTSKRVIVVPTRTVPQGISALLALNYQADLEANARAMEQAIQRIQTAEITRAVRSVQVNGMEVAEGEIIGLLNGQLTASGHDLDEVALEMLRQMEASQYEIITIYFGEDVSQDQAERLADEIRRRYPEQEVELIAGGQPYYHYILSAE
ncbi:TPA: DAK2 domain-containing protein, partial [Candidatus Bipolaricaulota bacterium]|nr:DAK2 domain-containing protein [Candidatus Bipolaricaulota bacterium]